MVTVICTTCMSLGLSGVSLNMNSKISLVPYLVAFISLENILAITQSVISTPGHLDVKIRIGKHSVEISEFSITHILREINFWNSRSAKSAILIHLEALNFDFYEFLHFLKAEKHQIQLIQNP